MSNLDCPNCGLGEMRIFHEASNVPGNSCILLGTPDEAKAYPRGDIALGYCDACGFVSNTAFDGRLTEYSGRYEETQGFSSTFNAFHERLARQLVERHDLHGKRIIEIGCGKGEFLSLLCELGNNEGIGFDPGFVEERLRPPRQGKVQFTQDFYSEKYAECQADFIACKMTLEHIHPTADFVGMVRRSIGEREGVVVFFQIPEATRILRDCAFEDIYYEHCSYFTAPSLRYLFEQNGFEVLSIATDYGEQYLTIEARSTKRPGPNSAAAPGAEESAHLVSQFPLKFRKKRDFWRLRLDRANKNGESVAVWGSGSKGVSFLTTLGIDTEVNSVVDINPYRAGYYMSGTGHPIVDPEQLTHIRPDTVILMNPIYTKEVRARMDELGIHPELVTL